MSPADPWTVLGLPPGSTVADARSARRSLAKQLHPDVYRGDSPDAQAELAARMTLVNRALADIERLEKAALDAHEQGPAPDAPTDEPEPRWWPPAPDVPSPTAGGRQPGGDHGHARADTIDHESFTVASLPAEAFESLFLAGYGLGDILVADEPYLLELYLNEPAPCFCQLTLVPEAGGSIVTIDVTAPAEGAIPTRESVRDVLVAELNRLASH